MRAGLFALLLVAGCLSDRRPSDDALRTRFAAHQETFETLRRMILVDQKIDVVRRDALVWSEPCAEWPHGCGRWVDGSPAPEALARVAAIPKARARVYLDGLARVGAVAVVRESRDRVAFWMHLAGIVPSGSTKSIVWTNGAGELLVDDTERGPMTAHGHRAARLTDEWVIDLEWN